MTGGTPAARSDQTAARRPEDALVSLVEPPVRPALVRRVGEQLAAGTYDPPVEAVVERLLVLFVATGQR